MTENCIGILRIAPKNETLEKGVPCTKCTIESAGSLEKSCELKWEKFWMPSKKCTEIWSAHGDDANEQEMSARMNIRLERQATLKIARLESFNRTRSNISI